MARDRSGNADAAFLPESAARPRTVSLPAIYRGDPPRRVRDSARAVTRLEPGLYPERNGQPCRVVSELRAARYPLVIEFADGTRGIARRLAIEVLA